LRRVTDAVHAAGGKIVIQLWQAASRMSLQPNGCHHRCRARRRAAGKTFTAAGF
jgi:2,4-dienoyl-CoA reductase-like NADH-dependent reductase (Old Yellow Enzyme family)